MHQKWLFCPRVPRVFTRYLWVWRMLWGTIGATIWQTRESLGHLVYDTRAQNWTSGYDLVKCLIARGIPMPFPPTSIAASGAIWVILDLLPYYTKQHSLYNTTIGVNTTENEMWGSVWGIPTIAKVRILPTILSLQIHFVPPILRLTCYLHL